VNDRRIVHVISNLSTQSSAELTTAQEDSSHHRYSFRISGIIRILLVMTAINLKIGGLYRNEYLAVSSLLAEQRSEQLPYRISLA
jgi:hypothetical protein